MLMVPDIYIAYDTMKQCGIYNEGAMQASLLRVYLQREGHVVS